MLRWRRCKAAIVYGPFSGLEKVLPIKTFFFFFSRFGWNILYRQLDETTKSFFSKSRQIPNRKIFQILTLFFSSGINKSVSQRQKITDDK